MEISKDQEKIILENAEKISDLTELTKLVFPEKDKIDGRSKEGRVVREFLVKNKINYETKHVYPKEDVVLSEDQKEFIKNNMTEGVTCMQICQLLYPDERVAYGSKEYAAVLEFVESCESITTPSSENAIGKKYSPPKAASKIIKKINDCAQKNIEETKLSVTERKSIESLGNFLASPGLYRLLIIMQVKKTEIYLKQNL